ncbi:MAG: class E sortase [Actinomycetaceae bacterium]|nr:class E sortase [Actinomycetaceae bacterium]
MSRYRATHTRRRPSPFLMFIGVVGELLITISLVLGLYVFWELYWSSWKVEGERDKVVAQFHAQLPEAIKGPGDKRTDAPPAFEKLPWGETLGILHIPQWDMQIPVVESTSSGLLDQGLAGHYSETQQPGEIGNFAVAAHRRGGGNNFRKIHTLEPGNRFVLETKNVWLVYEMRSNEIVDPSAVEVVYPVPHEKNTKPTRRLMTMTSCNPEFGNWERFIVFSELVYWMPRESGIPEELKGTEADKSTKADEGTETPRE